MSLEEAPSPPGLLSQSATLVFVALLVFTLVLAVVSIPAGFYAVFSGTLSKTFTYSSLVLTYLWVGPLPAILPFEVPLGGVFGVLMVVYSAMLILAASQGPRPWTAMRTALREGAGSLFDNRLLLTITSIGFLIFTTTWVAYATEAAGAPIGNPFSKVDPLNELTSLSFAPLREEVGFRVLLIGVVALILCLGRPGKDKMRALWRPSVAYEGLAVGGATTVIIWIALAFSSITFGACHVVCGGGGWDWGKIPEAVWGGVILGYLYVRFGLHIAVLAHWGIDYFAGVYAFFGQAAFGINWNSATTEFFGQYLVDIDMLFLFGLASFLVVLYVGITGLARRRARKLAFDLIHKTPPEGVPLEG